MDTDTDTQERAEIMRKLRETALIRLSNILYLAEILPTEAGKDRRVREEAAAQLRQLAGAE